MWSPNLRGFTVERFSDGVGLVPPGGRVHGGIRIRERCRPVAEIAQLVREAASELPLADGDVTPIESLITAEGEYAVIATLTGTHAQQPMERTLAFVLGEDHYTRIDGVTAIRARFAHMRALVREVACHYALGLGELRRRRFLYTPPRGWAACARGLVTDWRAPGDASSITVFPARALVESPIGEVERALREAEWAGFAGHATSTVPVETPHFQAGIVRTYEGTRSGAPHRVTVAVLVDDRFAYTCRFESASSEHAPAFEGLVSSIIPVPRATRVRRSEQLDGFMHWVD